MLEVSVSPYGPPLGNENVSMVHFQSIGTLTLKKFLIHEKLDKLQKFHFYMGGPFVR